MVAKSTKMALMTRTCVFCFAFHGLQAILLYVMKSISGRHIRQGEGLSIAIRSVTTFRSLYWSAHVSFSKSESCRTIKHERYPEERIRCRDWPGLLRVQKAEQRFIPFMSVQKYIYVSKNII